jgi:hypothetical protein
MDLWQKLASMAVGAALLLGCMTRAHANLGPERYARSHDTRTVWRPVPAKDRAQAERLIDGAARDLEEAALQSGFTSNSRVLYLLRSAQDQLIRAMGPLSTDRWLQVDRLLEDIDRVIARGAAQLAPLASSGRESFTPRASSRNELAVLARECQALVRHAAPRRLPDSDDIAHRRKEKSMNAKLKTGLQAIAVAAALASVSAPSKPKP